MAQMARDIFSIPGMSAEVERLFSSVKHMLGPTRSILRPEGIEAAECVRSWVKAVFSIAQPLLCPTSGLALLPSPVSPIPGILPS